MANESTVLSMENANRTSGASVRKNYSEAAAAGEQTDSPLANLIDDHPDKTWRAPAADVGYSTALIQWEKLRRVGLVSLLGHNLSAEASVRFTLDAEACRPVVVMDGVDDFGLSAGETIPAVTDYTVAMDVYLPPPGLDSESANCWLLELSNAGSGELIRFAIRPTVATGTNLHVHAFVYNFSTATILESSVRASGKWHRIRVRYRASDDRAELWMDGTMVASGTASAKLTGAEGATQIELCRNGIRFLPARIRAIAIYGRYWTDAEMAGGFLNLLSGTERGLVEGWNCDEGSGSSLVGVKGTTTIALTGSNWTDMAHPLPTATSGIVEAIGQWYRRQALRIGTGTVVTSPSLGTASRDLTISGVAELPDDYPAGNDEEILVFGTSAADAEAKLMLDSDGLLSVFSARGTPNSVSGPSVRGAGVFRWRVTLKSINSTTSDLSLYIGTGTDAETLLGTTQVGPYDALAACLLILGDGAAGSDNSHIKHGLVRIFGAIRLEADDDLLGPCDLSDPSIIECLSFGGDTVTSLVDPSRSYTVNGDTYETMTNPNPTRRVIGRPGGLGEPSDDEDGLVLAEVPWLIDDADIEAKELFIEIWDAGNADGFIEAGACPAFATASPAINRVYGAVRGWDPRKALRTSDGAAYRDNGFDAPTARVRLKNVERNTEDDEMLRRIVRRRRDLLCAVVIDARLEPGVPMPQHRLLDHYVCGTLEDADEIEDANLAWSEIDLRFRGLPPRRT